MKITWFGHAAFLIETVRKRIILDPYRSPDCGGYAPISERADIVVISHENDRYHSHLGQIVGPFEVVRALEISPKGDVVGGIRFESIPVFETPERSAGDEVSIVHFESDGARLVFLGDLGHALTETELGPLRGADVVLCPAGGAPTIDLELIPSLLRSLDPRFVIPMHYLIPGKINLAIKPIESFLAATAGLGWRVEHHDRSTLEIEPSARDQSPVITVMPPAR